MRAQAIAELQKLLASLSEEMLPRVAPHLSAFTDLLTTFLEDTNFRISLTSLQMISDLLDTFAEHIRNGPDSQAIFLAIVPRLMDKFADNKIVIRQANFRLTKKLMAIVPPVRSTRTFADRSSSVSDPLEPCALRFEDDAEGVTRLLLTRSMVLE